MRLGFGGDFLKSIKSIYTGDTIQCVVNGLSTRPIYLRRGLRQGCSLSPMLFALYISDLGNDLTVSSEGFQLGSVCVSGLLFADDIVLVSRTAQGLLNLLKLVHGHADALKMVINTDKDKSEVISPVGDAGDKWDIINTEGETVLSLSQVLEYKYLGCTMTSSILKTTATKVDQCIAKAHKYKGACIHISRDGPDVVDMVQAMWCNVAIPAILNGCEMIPFPESKISEIERVQNQIAKFALGVPVSTANVCTQTEMGFKPFKQTLFEHQLKFYLRLLLLDDARWAKQALRDHLSCAWNSPYLTYICKIRKCLGMPVMPMTVSRLYNITDAYFVNATNAQLAQCNLNWVKPIVKFQRQFYVREGSASDMIARFKFDNAGLGNKYPRPGHLLTRPYCPLCPTHTKNSVSHLTFFCFAVERVRKLQTSLSSFRDMCRLKGFSDDHIFYLFINGLDWEGSPVSLQTYLSRGEGLVTLTKAWLDLW